MTDRYKDAPDFAVKSGLLTRTPRVAAIHDLSCFGRCALTVILPVLSVMGIQAVPLPTALLSTHTGGFDGLYFKDLTHAMEKIPKHWQTVGVDFDSVYSGFLGSAEQIGTVLDFTSTCRRDNGKVFVCVDPVMGDDGVLYSTYNAQLVEGMKKLCYGADLITPNLTEACFLTGTPYRESFHTEENSDIGICSFTEEIMNQLRRTFGCRKIVITGLVSGESVTTAAYDDGFAEGNRHEAEAEYTTGLRYFTSPLLPRAYPGTGDVFASVLLGKLLSGGEFYKSVSEASAFVRFCIEFSQNYATPIRDGLVIEPCLGKLVRSTSGTF